MSQELNNRCVDAATAARLSGEVEGLSQAFAKSGLVLARLLDECRSKGVPEAMGMTWESWLERFCGHSLSDVRRKLQISRGLAGLPTKELVLLPESNAYALLKLPMSERTKRSWLDKAENMPVAEFRESVDKAIGKNGTEPEDWAVLSLPRSLYDSIKAAEAKIALVLHLDIEKRSDRILVWEAISALILTAEDEHLLIELKGEA